MTRPIDPRDIPFMSAVAWSEQLLNDLERGWEPPCTTRDLQQAAREAMRAIARDVSDPADYASMIEPVFAAALVGAYRSQNADDCGAWCVPDNAVLPYLRSLGLVSVRSRTLSGFGAKVRAELMKDER